MEHFIDYQLKFLTTNIKPKRALDVGAGALKQSIQMSDEKISVDAIEPDASLGVVAPFGVTLHRVQAQDFEYPINTYDLIVFRMVAQQLPLESVRKLLESEFPKTLLGGGGYVYLMIPAAYEVPVRLEEHYHIRGMLEFDVLTSNFKVIKTYILRKR